jgi:pantetheine-phosphate adenylyltransferase
VLADPPYAMTDYDTLARYLPHVLADDGLLVLESPRARSRRSPGSRLRTQPQVRLHARDRVRARMITAIAPGSYDPVTNGHIDVIGRAADIFDRVVVGVVGSPTHKTPMFSLDERVAFLKEALADLENVEVDVFSELVVEFARKWQAKAIVKGLRVISDFEWEFQMNQLNRTLAPEIETVYVMASPSVSFVSSSGVKEIASFGGRVDELVPEGVAKRFAELFPKGRPGTPENPQE